MWIDLNPTSMIQNTLLSTKFKRRKWKSKCESSISEDSRLKLEPLSQILSILKCSLSKASSFLQCFKQSKISFEKASCLLKFLKEKIKAKPNTSFQWTKLSLTRNTIQKIKTLGSWNQSTVFILSAQGILSEKTIK